MRRLVLTAALLSFALVPLTLRAQRGGGMHGGGSTGHAGFSGHSGMRAGGFSGGVHAGPPGMMSGARGPQGFHSSSGMWHGTVHHTHSGPNLIIGFHSHFRYPYYAYAPFGYYSPFAWDWYNSSYDRSNDDNYVMQRQTQQQFDQLYQQIQDLRDERDERQYSQAAAPQPVPAPSVRAEAKNDPSMSVVLVFLDRHIQEVKNYAIANEKVVVFDDHHIKKIPLADIDLAATQKLNDERGVDFQVPNPAGTE
jgi:hypothetical protein